MIGRRIGSWVLERELGQGGMGSVFLARHASLATFAAVKVLSPGLESEESFRQRFRREADLQAQLRHPNIARVLDYLEDSGHWFLVVEYLDRGSLADLLAQAGTRVPRPQVLTWMRQALAGLGYAHQKGVVHRDIKPANLLLNEAGEMVVADFGIARADSGPGLTTTGITIGTPQYMSPEQILTPEKIDRRSDIYSLGVVFYELLAGRKPFDSGSQFSILQAHVSEPPPLLRDIDPGIPPAFEEVVMRALAKKPEDRYPDCDSMARDLDRDMEVTAPGPRQAVPAGATVRATSLVNPAPVQGPPAISPAERSAQRRRSFQRYLLAGAAMVLAVAALFAFELGQTKNQDPEPARGETSDMSSSYSSVIISQDSDFHGSGQDRSGQNQASGQGQDGRQGRGGGRGQSEKKGEEPVREPIREKVQELPPPLGPSPVIPTLPDRPRIAVIATGDAILAGSLEQEMERRLRSNFDVADEHGESELDEFLQREGPHASPKALGVKLLKSGFQVLVLMRVEEAERRTVEAFGVSGSLKAARMRLNAYLLPANRSIGSGWTEPVEYTELSAPAKARQAFIGPTADLIESIDQNWNALRATAPAR